MKGVAVMMAGQCQVTLFKPEFLFLLCKFEFPLPLQDTCHLKPMLSSHERKQTLGYYKWRCTLIRSPFPPLSKGSGAKLTFGKHSAAEGTRG